MTGARLVLVGAALAACQSGPSEPLFEQDRTIELHVTSDTPFDRLVLLRGDFAQASHGVVTPEMLVAGTEPAFASTLYEVTPLTRDFDRSTQLARFTFRTPGLQVLSPRAVLAVAYRREPSGTYVVASAGMTDQLTQTDDPTVYTSTLDATVFLAGYVELFGTGTLCGAYNRTTYFVERGDADCDGIPDDADCDARRFCDPDASGPAQAGCNVASCERCELDGPACALGTRVTCHDVRGQPRTYTCDAGGACGATTVCLPATACDLGCGQPPAFDPVPCLETEWGRGAQPADAIDCQLPTTRGQLGSMSCPGGSAVEVALPFTGCTSPRVLHGYSTDLAAQATLTAPCTLRVTINSTQGLFLQPLLITMATATGSATVHVTLRPADGSCTTIGACDVVRASATCEL